MHRRGSALVYTIIVVFSVTAIVIAQARVATASNVHFSSKYASAKFASMADGLVDQAKADCYKSNGVLPSTLGATYTDGSVSATVSSHPTLKRAYELKVEGTVGGVVQVRRYAIGNRKAHPVFFGMWNDDNYNDASLATTLNGSAYIGGNSSFIGGWTVTGDLFVRGSATAVLAPNVSGNYLVGIRDRAMPPTPKADFTPVSTSIATSSRGSFSFNGVDANGYYPCLRRGSSLNMTGGVLSGKGTVLVDGNLDINGNYNYADSDSRVVFIVEGDLNINALATQIVGTFYVKDDIKLNGVSLNVLRGNLCAKKEIKRSLCLLTLTQDAVFVSSEDEARGHRVPGYWTAASGPR